MAPLPVVRRDTIPIVYDKFVLVSDVIGLESVGLHLLVMALDCRNIVVPSKHEPPPPRNRIWDRIEGAVTIAVGLLVWAAPGLFGVLMDLPDKETLEEMRIEEEYWRGAVLIQTCDDGTQIYRMQDGDFVKESSDTTETIEDPATACSLNQP